MKIKKKLEKSSKFNQKAWVVAVDMGYGHQRAAYPLSPLAYEGKIITTNKYKGIPDPDRQIWEKSEASYYYVSRLRERGRFGALAFKFFDKVQKIKPFYPIKEEIEPSIQLKQLYSIIRKGWGRDLIHRLGSEPRGKTRGKPLPLITTFFTAAHMAEYWGYPGPIYVVVTDSDISRAWAPLGPSTSKMYYLAPTERVVARLERFYGVRRDHIFLTGFPLPQELIGKKLEIVREDTARRIEALDPQGTYRERYGALLKKYLGKTVKGKKDRPVSIAYVVGGAGAQAKIGLDALASLATLIRERKIRLNLVAGTHGDIAKAFHEELHRVIKDLALEGDLVRVVQAQTKEEYFKMFNEVLRTTDILWTKPSELSFYAGLGLPIIIAPPLGSQERKNRRWLTVMGAGLEQLESEYVHEWLPDLIKSGRLAEAAMQGFINIEKNAVERIAEVIDRS